MPLVAHAAWSTKTDFEFVAGLHSRHQEVASGLPHLQHHCPISAAGPESRNRPLLHSADFFDLAGVHYVVRRQRSAQHPFIGRRDRIHFGRDSGVFRHVEGQTGFCPPTSLSQTAGWKLPSSQQRGCSATTARLPDALTPTDTCSPLWPTATPTTRTQKCHRPK